MAVDPSLYRTTAARRLGTVVPQDDAGMTTTQKTQVGGQLLGTLLGAYFGNPAAGAAIGGAAGNVVGGAVDADNPESTSDAVLRNSPQVLGGIVDATNTPKFSDEEYKRLKAMLAEKRGLI